MTKTAQINALHADLMKLWETVDALSGNWTGTPVDHNRVVSPIYSMMTACECALEDGQLDEARREFRYATEQLATAQKSAK